MASTNMIIKEFGPIKSCEVDIDQFTVITGEQASGKSTVAKMVFFFLSLKDVLWHDQIRISKDQMERENWFKSIPYLIERYFFTLFGEVDLNKDSYVRFNYDAGTYIELFYGSSCEWRVCLSDDLFRFLKKWSLQTDTAVSNGKNWLSELKDVFHSPNDCIYIPAGRSAVSVFSKILTNIMLTMDDSQKEMIDYCNVQYYTLTQKIAPLYEKGIESYYLRKFDALSSDKKHLLDLASSMAHFILKGEYRNRNGIDKLIIDSTGDEIDMTVASSGQQEAVWVINLLVYYLMLNSSSVIIIEEPESHLYPEAQQFMTKMIALAGRDNKIIVTTHSPYVLGALNNMVYASNVSKVVDKNQVNKIVDGALWVDYDSLRAYYIENGNVSSCCDDEICLIKNEVIDGVSDVITQEFEDILAVKSEVVADGSIN